MKKPTKAQKRKVEFQQQVYAVLRLYQDGKIKGNGTCVGQLDQPLTEIADRIIAIFTKMEGV